MFQKATKAESRLRLNLDGPSGSGKSYTALLVGSYMAKKCGGRLAYIDTERGSASKYSDEFDFDVVELHTDQSPQAYIERIKAAEEAKYPVLIIDSLSHAWAGKGGALEMVDNVTARSKSSNSWAAWRHVTPYHNALVDAILASNCHVIATLRVKSEWVTETNEKGKTAPKKIGLAPIMRDGIEYEFDVSGSLDLEHTLCINKTRCKALNEKVFRHPSDDFSKVLWEWLTVGVDPSKKFSPPAAVPIPVQQSVATEKRKPDVVQYGITRQMMGGLLSEVETVLGVKDITEIRKKYISPFGGLSLGEIDTSKYIEIAKLIQSDFSNAGKKNTKLLDEVMDVSGENIPF